MMSSVAVVMGVGFFQRGVDTMLDHQMMLSFGVFFILLAVGSLAAWRFWMGFERTEGFALSQREGRVGEDAPCNKVLDGAILDEATEARVFANLRTLNLTCICVAHRESTLAHADWIYRMRDGRIMDNEVR